MEMSEPRALGSAAVSDFCSNGRGRMFARQSEYRDQVVSGRSRFDLSDPTDRQVEFEWVWSVVVAVEAGRFRAMALAPVVEERLRPFANRFPPDGGKVTIL